MVALSLEEREMKRPSVMDIIDPNGHLRSDEWAREALLIRDSIRVLRFALAAYAEAGSDASPVTVRADEVIEEARDALGA